MKVALWLTVLSTLIPSLEGFTLYCRTIAPSDYSSGRSLTPRSLPVDRRATLSRDTSSHTAAAAADGASSPTSTSNSTFALTKLEDDAVSEPSLFGLLLRLTFQTLSRPSVVSLPRGVLLCLVALPFLATLPQALLTVALFSWFSHLIYKVRGSSSEADQDKTPSPFWDTVSLGVAFEVAHMLLPRHEVPKTVVHQVAAHHGFDLTGPLLTMGLMGAAFILLKLKGTASTAELSSDAASDPVEQWGSIYDIKEVQLLNSWDEAMVTRETNAVVLPSPGQKDGVRRDCYVPPGAIGIFMVSTPNGPIIHSVKEDCSLANYVSPGDLIVQLDGVNTQSCTAEEVMQKMMARRNHRRKLTVVSPTGQR